MKYIVLTFFFALYSNISLKYISTAKYKFLLFYRNPFEYYEDVLRDHRISVAFIPIYDSKKSKRPTQSYECDSARAMRLYHYCWRHVLGQWKDKTQNVRVVSLGNGNKHQFH